MTDGAAWKSKLQAGRLAALASLTPEEAAQRAADDAAERRARAERKAAKAEQAALVNQRLALGDTPEEIAGRLGITLRALQARARTWGHALAQRAGFRRLSAWVAERHVRQLDALAAEAGLTREQALERIAAAILGDGVAARRIVQPAKKRQGAAKAA
jgi:hypothetical protein